MGTIFLSHSSKDNAVAADMKVRLDQQGYRSVFLDFDPADGIPVGRDWEKELYSHLRACRAFLVLCSEHSMSSPWCFAEITHAKALGKYVVPVKIAPCTINQILTSRQVLDLTTDVETGYRRLFAALKSSGLDPHDAFDWDASRPPYPGMLSFAEQDAAVFFGRDQEIRDSLDVLDRLQHFGGPRLVMVFGASGSGKSSFVRAGLVPRLKRDRERWLLVPPMRPLTDPLRELALAMSEAFTALGAERPWRDLHDMLCAAVDGTALLDLATDLRAAARCPQASVLLIIDQFEENLATANATAAAKFLGQLTQALDGLNGSLMALGTMRSDFLSEFQRHPELNRLPYEAVHLGPISVDEFSLLIEQPAEMASLQLGAGLTQALVSDTKSPDALPLLAFSLRELFDRHGGDGLLTLEEYRTGLGSLDRAVARIADSVFAAQPLSPADEEALRTAFLALVRIDEEGKYVRQIARWSDLPQAARPWLERLVDLRLLISRTDDGVRTLEVAHEALFRSWERLRGWLREKREFLLWRRRVSANLTEWERTARDDGALLRGAMLAEATRWLELEPDELTSAESEYIRVGLERQTQQEQRWKQLFEQAERERKAAVEAERRATRALADSRARELVLYAEATIEKDPQLSLLLGLEAAEQERDPDGTAMTSILSLLRRAVLATPWRVAAQVSGIECFVLNPTRPTIVIGTQHSGVFEVSLQDGTVVQTFATPGWVDTVDVTSDGTLIVAGARDKTVRIWETASGREVKRFTFDQEPQSAHWRPGSRQLAIGLAKGNASPTKVYDHEWRRQLFEVPGIRAAWSPDGTLLATGGGDGTVYLYTDSGQSLATMRGHDRYVHKVAWSPDGRYFATVSVDNYVLVWDAQQRALHKRLRNEFALSAAWSADGSLLGSGSGEKFVTIWDSTTFRERFRVTASETITGQQIFGSGAAGYVLDIAWTRDGSSFLVSDREGGILRYSTLLFTSEMDDRWLASARAQVRRSFSTEERERYGIKAQPKSSEPVQ
jgi:hypothetical protein